MPGVGTDRTTSPAILEVMESYSNKPLGSVPGDPGRIPANFVESKAIYWARNLSAERKRRKTTYPISYLGGAQEAIDKGKIKAHGTSAQSIQEAARNRDMSIDESGEFPVNKALYHDSNSYVIWHTDPDTGEVAKKYPIPEGLADLYVGNWDRIHSKDARTRSEELERIQNAWGKRNPCFREGNPDKDGYAYIEIIREEIKAEPKAVDLDKVYANSAVEI